MKHYLRCSAEVLKIVQSIIDEHYQELRSARVTVEALTVHSDKEGEDSLTLRGRPCYAIIRKTNTKERVAGRADAEIIIDRAKYQDLSERQRRALLHHEVNHLQVRYDKDDEIKRDTAGRPVLTIREHDYEVGWFHNVAELYGSDSIEVHQARMLLAGKLGQIYFNFDENQSAIALAASGPLAGMRDLVKKGDGVESISITTGGKGVKIDKEGVHPIGTEEKTTPEQSDPEITLLLPAAITAIKDLGMVKTSGIQRRLRIGYNRACHILTALEKLGVIGPDKGAEPREILVDLATYQLPSPHAA